MKKLLILTIVFISLLFVSCSKKNDAILNNLNADNETTIQTTQSAELPKIKIVSTIFPVYDYIKQIIKGNDEHFDSIYLLDNGVDLHNFQPTVKDIANIKNSDMFIYVGGESDHWVENVFDNVVDKNVVKINLMEVLKNQIKVEEMKEGMQEDEEHEHGHIDVNENEIENRELKEFNGEWKSLFPLLKNGDLDEYVSEHAKEHGEPFEEVKNEQLENWNTDINKISINENTISFEDVNGKIATAEYTNAGFSIVKDEDGEITNVRYQFETTSDEAPKFVQFNDHNYKSSLDVEHFHIYCGNESFDDLNKSEQNPFFVQDSITTNEILQILMEHGEHEEEFDEHVWLSLKNAKLICQYIKNELIKLDNQNKDLYENNCNDYLIQLDELDNQYKEVVDSSVYKTILFGDRFPFRYLVDDYGIDYYAAFKGCSAESEASFETVINLSKKVDELDLKHILKIESSNDKISKTIIDNTTNKDQDIISMNSMQSISVNDVKNGANYLDIMKQNLTSLKNALN